MVSILEKGHRTPRQTRFEILIKLDFHSDEGIPILFPSRRPNGILRSLVNSPGKTFSTEIDKRGFQKITPPFLTAYFNPQSEELPEVRQANG